MKKSELKALIREAIEEVQIVNEARKITEYLKTNPKLVESLMAHGVLTEADMGRRDFLKKMGMGLAAGGLTAAGLQGKEEDGQETDFMRNRDARLSVVAASILGAKIGTKIPELIIAGQEKYKVPAWKLFNLRNHKFESFHDGMLELFDNSNYREELNKYKAGYLEMDAVYDLFIELLNSFEDLRGAGPNPENPEGPEIYRKNLKYFDQGLKSHVEQQLKSIAQYASRYLNK